MHGARSLRVIGVYVIKQKRGNLGTSRAVEWKYLRGYQLVAA